MKFSPTVRTALLLVAFLVLGSRQGWTQTAGFVVSSPVVYSAGNGMSFVTFTTSSPALGKIDYQVGSGATLHVEETDFDFNHALLVMAGPGDSIQGTIMANAETGGPVATSSFGPVVIEGTNSDVTFKIQPTVFLVRGSTANSQNQAVVAFTTDQPTTARIDYGPSGMGFTESVVDEELTNAHALFLSDLAAGTPYSVLVSAIAEDGTVIASAPMTITGTVLDQDYGPGDVNGDGSVTINDALLALNYLVGRYPLAAVQVKSADANGDGKVTVGDVILILQAAMGITGSAG